MNKKIVGLLCLGFIAGIVLIWADNYFKERKREQQLSLPAPEKLLTGLTLQGEWVLPLRQGSMATAAYMTIYNTSDREIQLVEALSPQFDEVVFHDTDDADGSMSEMDEITIPAGGFLVLKPDGVHLMLMGPLDKYEVGDTIQLHLVAKNGETLVANVDIVAFRSESGEDIHYK